MSRQRTMKIRVKTGGRGPVEKDGRTPFLEGESVWVTTRDGWRSERAATATSVLEAMLDPQVETIEVISAENRVRWIEVID